MSRKQRECGEKSREKDVVLLKSFLICAKIYSLLMKYFPPPRGATLRYLRKICPVFPENADGFGEMTSFLSVKNREVFEPKAPHLAQKLLGFWGEQTSFSRNFLEDSAAWSTQKFYFFSEFLKKRPRLISLWFPLVFQQEIKRGRFFRNSEKK